MITEPKIVERGNRPYIAIRETVDAEGIPAVVDTGFPRLFDQLAARGVEPAGPPFIRYRSMSDGVMELDLGVPYPADVADDGWSEAGVSHDVLPAGRYVHLVHTGPYDDLVEAHAAIDDWAEAGGHSLAGDLGARVEHYVTDPRAEPDSAAWVTEVEEPLASAPGAA